MHVSKLFLPLQLRMTINFNYKQLLHILYPDDAEFSFMKKNFKPQRIQKRKAKKENKKK